MAGSDECMPLYTRLHATTAGEPQSRGIKSLYNDALSDAAARYFFVRKPRAGVSTDPFCFVFDEKKTV